jgi:RNA:NAD 2'-phosphotransferase (TPT1/KptA family)
MESKYAGGGAQGGRQGRRPSNRDTQISKLLSWILRHGALEVGLNMR